MQLYNDYSTYLRRKYGSKVYRIGIDAGYSCPFRCVYCNENGSRSSYTRKIGTVPGLRSSQDRDCPNFSKARDSVEKQLSERIEYLKSKKAASKFIAYFQAFTNTNAPLDHLKDTYDRILPFKEIVGLSIGTRPDCIDSDKLDLISSYKNRYEVWLEYGLQSIHDRTLKAINRGHNFNDFLTAYKLTKKFAIPVCAHVIIGLPGETRKDILETADKLTDLGVDAVKIHLLHVLKGSALENQYREGKVSLLTQGEYVDLVCDFLERLSEGTVIQRLTGQGSREDHIAPAWAQDKLGTIQQIKDTLMKRGSFQGKN